MTNTIYIHQPEKSVSFTRLPNFLFEAPTFTVKPDKAQNLKDQMLVLAPHEGIVPSDIWLTCRKKLMNNMKIQSARKATHTWLAGKIKCGNCGYALMSIFNPSGKQYLRCTKRLDNKSCPGCGKIITSELEAVVYQQMVKKLDSYKTLTGRKKAAKANPKIAALQVELAHVGSEIEKLVDSLRSANNVLLSYVNVKIAELDGRKQELLAQIAELTVEAISPEQVRRFPAISILGRMYPLTTSGRWWT